MNGYEWYVQFVSPRHSKLMDRTHSYKVATTDPRDRTIYISEDIGGDFLARVVIHELGHCAIFSFDLLRDIHRMVKREYWIEAEEWTCNFIADYGLYIFEAANRILEDDTLSYISEKIERMVA